MPRSRKVKYGLSWAIFGQFKWGQELSNRYRYLTQQMTTKGRILLEIYLDGKTLYFSDKQVIVEDTYEYEPIIEDFGVSDLQAGSNGIARHFDGSPYRRISFRVALQQ